MFPGLLIPNYLEERAHLQQTQGAARPIHTWPGEGAVEIADFFTELLDRAFVAFEEPNEEVTAEKPKEKRRFFRRHKRGSKRPEILTIETAIEQLGEIVETTDTQSADAGAETEISTSIAAMPSIETDWTEPSWQDDELAAKQQEVSNNTGSWNFKLEIEKPEEEKN